MKYVELNPEGDFSNWPNHQLEALKYSTHYGAWNEMTITKNVAQWSWKTIIPPQTLLDFRLFPHDFSWYSPTGGIVVSRNANGKIMLCVAEKGDGGDVAVAGDSYVSIDIENVGAEPIIIEVTEYLNRHENLKSTFCLN